MTDEQAPSGSPATPAATPDYFAFFHLPRKLGLDGKALERSFYQMSRELHPDRFAQASAEKQQWSLAQTSLLNDAYRALKQPLSRTEYLLKLEGVAFGDEAGAKKIPPALLAEVFELNMQLEELRMNRQMGEDDPQLREDLKAAEGQFTAQMAEVDQSLAAEWTKWDAAVDSGDQAAGTAVKESMAALLDRRRYIRNLLRDVAEVLA